MHTNQHNDDRPLVAITLGDPAGVGPETVVGAWPDPTFQASCRAVVIGQPAIVRRAAQLLNSPAKVAVVDAPDAIVSAPDVIPCLPAGSEAAVDVPPAVIDPRGGQAAYDALLVAAELAKSGQVDAITTGPLHKAALWQAGHHYPGHTELLAELCGVRDFAMMLYLGPDAQIRSPGGLGVVHVTLHTALKNVFAALTPDEIVAKARLADRVMRRMLPQTDLDDLRPRIGVCALNPHAGEEGLFGDEERTIIRPAVELGMAAGLNLTGPLPTDTLMVRARDGEFDAVVAMYHDQGHIALKLLGMHRAVNITLGLQIVRTSVAHGTAFDLAWQGRAETSSMVEAVRVASRLAKTRSDVGRGKSG
jgi:4-hydroxythreonine-4-phosphate dehydrogenase